MVTMNVLVLVARRVGKPLLSLCFASELGFHWNHLQMDKFAGVPNSLRIHCELETLTLRHDLRNQCCKMFCGGSSVPNCAFGKQIVASSAIGDVRELMAWCQITLHTIVEVSEAALSEMLPV